MHQLPFVRVESWLAASPRKETPLALWSKDRVAERALKAGPSRYDL
jgi:hypothetical protein